MCSANDVTVAKNNGVRGWTFTVAKLTNTVSVLAGNTFLLTNLYDWTYILIYITFEVHKINYTVILL